MKNNFINENNKLLITRLRRTEENTLIKKGDNVFLFKKKVKKGYPDIGDIGEKFIVINIDNYNNVWVRRLRDNETFKHPIHKNYLCKDNELRDTRLEFILDNL